MSEKQAIIVIPVYTTQLTVSEHAALRQCFDILSSYPKCFVKPESLDITSLVRDYPANHIVPFPDTYFKGIAGYNRLMMSPEFYETFAQWEYILIYQTDAWVFSDRLSEWCSKGYDYIGAPWIPKPKYRKLYYRIFNFLKRVFVTSPARPITAASITGSETEGCRCAARNSSLKSLGKWFPK